MSIGTWTCATHFTAFKYAFRNVDTHLERYGQILHINLAVQIGGTAAIWGHSMSLVVSRGLQSCRRWSTVKRIHRKPTERAKKTWGWVTLMFPLGVHISGILYAMHCSSHPPLHYHIIAVIAEFYMVYFLNL